ILNEKKLENIAKGVKIKNIQYKPFSFQILKKNKNSWIEFELFEGKKNEVRNICSILRLKVNKLLRIQFGPFKLNNLRPGQYIKADKTEYKQYENYFRKI
ncbi:MAG: pseudouridine synthase, partial [Candidatus Fonsibacter sp.]